VYIYDKEEKNHLGVNATTTVTNKTAQKYFELIAVTAIFKGISLVPMAGVAIIL
jgi:hypothetical protein